MQTYEKEEGWLGLLAQRWFSKGGRMLDKVPLKVLCYRHRDRFSPLLDEACRRILVRTGTKTIEKAGGEIDFLGGKGCQWLLSPFVAS